jgi:hypothetical protein
VVTGKFRLWTGLILTKLVSVPTESNPIRLLSFGCTNGRTNTMKAKAKKPAAKKAAAKKPAAKKKKR